MKNLRIVFLFMSMFALGLVMSSCGAKHDHDHKTEKSGKEYTSDFICPMHCEGSGSDKAGTCPTCGMDYVKNEKNEKANNNAKHDHDDHEGHNH